MIEEFFGARVALQSCVTASNRAVKGGSPVESACRLLAPALVVRGRQHLLLASIEEVLAHLLLVQLVPLRWLH